MGLSQEELNLVAAVKGSRRGFTPTEPAERETIIRWDESGDDCVVVWTTVPKVARRLLRHGLEPCEVTVRKKDGLLHGMEFRVPRRQLQWTVKRRQKRQLSEAERAEVSARLRYARNQLS